MKKVISELDLAKIKENLITYLKTKPEFSDFNFEGSAINTLLDLLAYFIHYTGFYVNANFNEMFLETASLRNSVVTLAKALGYFPERKNASQIQGTITYNGNSDYIVIPAETVFSGKNTLEEEFQLETRGQYIINKGESIDITLYQQKTEIYTVNFDINNPEIKLPYGCEIEQFFVFVDGELWDFYDYKIDLNSESKVYFYEETYDGKIKIQFGNGLYGKQPNDGSEITIKMYLTKGAKGNGIKGETIKLGEIIYDNDNNPVDDNEIVLNFSGYSTAGADEENIESIKLNAPKIYEAQNRTVSKNDYIAFLSKLKWIEMISVWGGEEFEPPVYGTVFLAIKPKNGLYIDDAEKAEILSLLENKMPVSLQVKFKDPFYIHFDMFVKAYVYSSYDINEVKTNIETALRNYVSENTSYFNELLKYSRLIEKAVEINGVSHVNLNLLTHALIDKSPVNSYEIELFNSIIPGTVNSYDFIDDEAGNLVLKTTGEKIGTVDYTKGILKFQYDLSEEAVNENMGELDNSGNLINYRIDFILKENDIQTKFNILLNLQNLKIEVFEV